MAKCTSAMRQSIPSDLERVNFSLLRASTVIVGLVVGHACDDSGTNSIQRILVGVLTQSDQQDEADKAAKALLEADLNPLYAIDLSRRDCKYNPPAKSG